MDKLIRPDTLSANNTMRALGGELIVTFHSKNDILVLRSKIPIQVTHTVYLFIPYNLAFGGNTRPTHSNTEVLLGIPSCETSKSRRVNHHPTSIRQPPYKGEFIVFNLRPPLALVFSPGG